MAMKSSLLLFVLSVFVFHVSAQQSDLNQPDSIYSKNKVKKRIVSYSKATTRSSLIFIYDRSGRLIEHDLTDNETGKHNQYAIRYIYDNSGKCVTDTLTTNDPIDKEISKYFYDDSQKLIRKETYNVDGKRIKIETTSYNPLTKTDNYYDSNTDSVYRTQTAVYDYPFAYIRFYGSEIRDGKRENWNYKFKNYFDESNRLILREDSLWRPVKRITYQYNKKGLLIQKDEYRGNPGKNPPMSQFIRYEFWK
jgi:hypothetical protein